MKTLARYIFLFVLFVCISYQAFSQGRGSVRYTIVVSEEMVAQRDDMDNRGNASFNNRLNRNARENTGEDVAVNVSVSLQAPADNNHVHELAAFETEITASGMDSFSGMLNENITKYDTYTTELHSEIATSHPGQYLVVMEYN
ncbi:MAG: hypothetical protein RG741_02260 [Bacteroidales bacterium]|nr:hypothetical protein [Bacteroidales bacterium]